MESGGGFGCNTYTFMNRIDRLASEILERESRIPDQYEQYLKYLILEKNIPLAVVLGVLEGLVKANRELLIRTVLLSLTRRGDEHPLLAEFEGKFYWAVGEKERARSLVSNGYRRWKRPYLHSLLLAFENDQ